MKEGGLLDGKSSGAIGILAIAACIGVLIAAKIFFPSIFNILVWIIGIIILLVLALLAAVIYFALKKPKKGSEEEKKAKTNVILSEGRNKVMSIRRGCVNIRNTEIKNAGIRVCSGAEKILGILRKKPELIPKNRQFFTYYLPTLGSIAEKYERIEKSGIESSDMKEKVLLHLGEIKEAFDKQYESLFAGDMLDLSVEIEAMTIACKRDGLLSDEDFSTETENTVNLEL